MRIAYLHYLCPDDTACHHVRQFVVASQGLGHRVDVYAMNPAGGEAPAASHAEPRGSCR